MHSTTNNNVCLSPLLQNSGTEEKRLTSTERENISKEKALTKTGIMFENQHLLNDWKKEKNKMGEFEEENNIINDDEDGFEELRDFQLLLMPAARQSAARRFNSIPSPLTANKINEQQKQQKIRKNCENTENIGPIPPFVQRRQRNINNNYILNRPPPAFLETTIKTTNKFPLIDEDLLMLISRNNNNNKNISINGTSPSNLCRLITNVSECKWTTPTTNLDETQNLEKIKIEEKPKKMTNLQNSSFNSNNLIINQNPKNNKNFKKSKTYSSPISSNKIPKISKTSSSHFNSVIVPSENSKENNILINQKNKELNDSSTNCDCTSIAFAAFRRRQLGNNNSKNKKLNKNDEEDIYQKIDSSSSKSFKNVDSGISSSPCSSGGSIEGDKNNLLPPPPLFEDKNQVKEAVVLLSRRRQTLNYLLGNIVKFLLIASPPKRTTKTNKIKKNKKDDNKKAIIEIKQFVNNP
uniref:Uncharacterized protein n=1 Tax=Meloidogyne hapla TaxID=6305 RepID=A0A1I8BQ75_MELHA